MYVKLLIALSTCFYRRYTKIFLAKNDPQECFKCNRGNEIFYLRVYFMKSQINIWIDSLLKSTLQ